MGNKNISIKEATGTYLLTLEKFLKERGGLYTKTGNALAKNKYDQS
jgi:hypothetical protein